MHNQKGFSPILIIITIATIALLGFIAWRVWDTNQNNNQTQQTTTDQSKTTETTSTNSQPTQTTDPNQGYVVIKEWGVRFKPVEGLDAEDVVYFADEATDGDEKYVFTTKTLIDREPSCDNTGIVGVVKTGGEKDAGLMYGNLLGTIGGKYYYTRSLGAACSSSSDNYTFESQQGSLIRDSILSLEAAN
ncbi:MAG: hypothetical protein PVI21_01265 [Candidatus Woesebacteria bacterium]|jgi:hypothetical protein